jgi:hypothetical protein
LPQTDELSFYNQLVCVWNQPQKWTFEFEFKETGRRVRGMMDYPVQMSD